MELRKEIYDETNGLTYTLVGEYYIPNLVLEREEKVILNKYGRLRLKYLKEHKNFDNIFNGIIKCADCGYAMTKRKPHRKKRVDAIDNVLYTCNNYRNFGSTVCSEHAIEARTLVEMVLKDINYYADIALKDENIVNKLKKQLSTMTEKESNKYKQEEKKLKKRLSELDNLFSNLYEDKVLKHITEYNYLKISEKYQNEQNEIKARFYDLRGSFATTSLRNGCEIKDIAEVLGHRRIETTEKYYISSTEKDKIQVAKSFEKSLKIFNNII